MATVTKPMALDESFNTTESTPRNIADVLAEGLDNIAEAVSPSTTNFAPDYDDTQTYNTNDKVIYQGLLYVCLEDSVTGAWDGTKWQQISVADFTADLLPIQSGSATNTKDYIDSKIAIKQAQVVLPSAVTITEGTKSTLLSNVDITSLSYSALDDISQMGTNYDLFGCVLTWTNNSSCIAVDTLVDTGNKVTLSVYGVTNQSVSAVRLLTWWKHK